jgi:hypothetical protein
MGHQLVVHSRRVPSWIFSLFFGIDANFRMVRKKVSSEVADPSLSCGWAYFVEMTKYYEHLAQYGDQVVEVSSFTVLFISVC